MKIPACFLPARNRAIEAPIDPKVKMWKRLVLVAPLIDSSTVLSIDSARSELRDSSLPPPVFVCVSLIAPCTVATLNSPLLIVDPVCCNWPTAKLAIQQISVDHSGMNPK